MASNGSSKSRSKKNPERAASLSATRGPGKQASAARGAVAAVSAKSTSRSGSGGPVKASQGQLPAAKDTWTLRLYVAGDSPKSRAALSNLRRLCEAHLAGK